MPAPSQSASLPLVSSSPALVPPPPASMPMGNPHRTITLFCWVLGSSCCSFSVDIEDRNTVAYLKEKILLKKPATFAGIEVDRFRLWQVSILDAADLDDEIIRRLLPPNQLVSSAILSNCFPPPGPPQRTIHIVVQLPPSPAPRPSEHTEGGPPSKKRKLDYDAPEYKYINIAPSYFAKLSTFRDAMVPRKRGREIYIHNRPIDFSSVPLTLISPIFGRLSDDVFATPGGDLRSIDFAPARNLANMLSKLEKGESTRKEAFCNWLLETLQGIEDMKLSYDEHELLGQHTVGLPRLATLITRAEKKSLESDGHVEWRDYVLIITEGSAKGSSEAHWQSMAYFRAYYMQKRCSYRVGESCLPAILIAYHGPYIDISGAIVCPDGSVQVEALTPGLRVDCDFRDDRQRNLLARFVRALRNAFKELQEFYKSSSGPVSGYSSREDVESPDRWFPYRNSYKDRNGVEHSFEYMWRLADSVLVFAAEHTDPNADLPPIAVKFTRTYSEYVHNLLAAEGFAPELFAVEDLAGGWKMVVMEFLLYSDWTMLEMKKHSERWRYKEKLWRALSVIHGNDFVHGDFRGPNIFVSENGDVKLIDFDYCGRHEQGRYPREWDHRNGREDAKEGDLMRKEHDVFLFNRIFDGSHS